MIANDSRPGFIAQVRELTKYHELIRNLTRKELKVKYKNSALGFLWSLFNPLLYLVIFTIVFRYLLGFGIPYFPFYLLSGLLAWNLFSTGTSAAAISIVANSTLVTKSYFPRKALPLAAVGASAYHLFLQLMVLVGAMVLFGYFRFWDVGLLLFPLAVVCLLLFLSALSFALAALNVYFRDVQHLLELVLLAWFWITPIVYPIAQIATRLKHHKLFWDLYLANPVTNIVIGFQRAFYSQITPMQDGKPFPVLVTQPLSWYFMRLVYVGSASVVVFVLCWMLFSRLEPRFAEEL